MTTPDTLELLRKAAERAKPYWGSVDMMLGGNPIAADIVAPFAQSISPDIYLALLDRLDALEGLLRESVDLTGLCTTPERFTECGTGDVFLRMTAHNAKARALLSDHLADAGKKAPTTLADEGRDAG